MNNAPLIKEDTLRAIQKVVERNAPDLLLHISALLKRDPVVEKNESSPAMFAVDLPQSVAIMILDVISVIGDDPTGQITFDGQKVDSLAQQWRKCMS